MRDLVDKIEGQVEVDLAVVNVSVLDVFNLKFVTRDVIIDQGKIIGFGQVKAKKVIDGSGKYLVPGLIDAHMHIESTMLNPVEYSKVALANGVTTAFADVHEIANVLGTDGIDYMLEAIESAKMDIQLMLPSSVPCSNIATENRQIDAASLYRYYDNSAVLGLAELMDYNRVERCDPDYIQKINDCLNEGLFVDGHMAGLSSQQVDLLRNYGVSSDHECETAIDLLERLERGVNVFIREGSAAKNFKQLMPAVTIANNPAISFCSDDISIVDLIDHGSINNIIKLGINSGYQPELLLKMATYNAARAYNIRDKGAIAPGYIADLVLVSDLSTFSVEATIKDGVVIKKTDLDFTKPDLSVTNNKFDNTLNVVVDPARIDLNPPLDIAIGAKNGTLVTTKLEIKDKTKLCKIVVINRYGLERYFVSYIAGFDLKDGAIASTISHDSHNLVIIGSDDQSIRKLLKCIKQTSGGIYTYLNDKFEVCPLAIAGLISNLSINQTYTNFKSMLDTVDLELDEPFLTMSFLTLDVVPDLKITDCGLYDFSNKRLMT